MATPKHPPTVLAYFARVSAEVLNFRRAMVKEHRGNYYTERALIKIDSDGTVHCSNANYAPTEEEADAMRKALANFDFPRTIEAQSADTLIPHTKGGPLYLFRSRQTGLIKMVQERRNFPNGTKAYIPWVLLSNGEWAAMEPDGPLPFWKPDPTNTTRIMIHEGAKCAAAASAIATDPASQHPWAGELRQYEHWGMIGGALAPHRTDYDELRSINPTEVVYFCDNDNVGLSAAREVSRHWRRAMKYIYPGDDFPPSWDIADPMPAARFDQTGHWNYQSLASLMQPGTWATEEVRTGERGRPATIISSVFAEEWLHVIEPEVYVHKDFPHRILSPHDFNQKVDPFSGSKDTAGLLKKQLVNAVDRLRYNPDMPSGIYMRDPYGLVVNAYRPTTVVPEPGDVTPWMDFLENFIIDAGDRTEVMRWCATLIARPDIRMRYGLLMISEQQGTGKTTLGEKILWPLVGTENASAPSETDVVDSSFNAWAANKRLIIINEIYAGHSFRAYNRLKPYMTDTQININQKFMNTYSLENWLQVYACSNSERPLIVPDDDRRWFIPMLTSALRPQSYWDSLNNWLKNAGGLRHILAWAHDWLTHNEPVLEGAVAPMSALKREMIEDSYSPGQEIVISILEDIDQRMLSQQLPPNTFVLDRALVEHIRNRLYEGRLSDRLERPMQVRKIAKRRGWLINRARSEIRAWGPNSIGARILTRDDAIRTMTPGQIAAAGGRPLDLGTITQL